MSWRNFNSMAMMIINVYSNVGCEEIVLNSHGFDVSNSMVFYAGTQQSPLLTVKAEVKTSCA